MLRDLLHDLRHGARGLRRSPGFAAVVVLSLGLGMGANAAIFGLIDVALLRRLPVRAPEELVFSGDNPGQRGAGPLPAMRLPVISYPLYKELRAAPGFAGFAAEQSGFTRSVVARGGAEEGRPDALGQCVTGNYFEVLGVAADRGRVLGAGDESAPGANAVVVLSHRFWRRRFGGDPGVLGERLLINGTSYTVVGIAAPAFTGTMFGSAIDFWVPITMQAELMHPRAEDGFRSWLEPPHQWFLLGVGRLATGVSRVSVEAAANVIFQRFLAQHPPLVRPGTKPQAITLGLVPGAQGVSPFRREIEYPLLILMAGVGLLLIIVCLNVSHLLLARAGQREREMSIRTAIGATRGRLARQLFAEGLVLATLGGAAAVLVAPWLTQALLSMIPDAHTLGIEARSSGRAPWFTAAVALGISVFLGLVPAWQAAEASPQRALVATARSLTAGRSRRLASRVLLALQVALSLVLLAAAGVLAASLGRLRAADKGFDEQHLLLVDLRPRVAGMSEERARALPEVLLPAVQAVAGVRSASLSVYPLLGESGWSRSLRIAGVGPAGSGQQTPVNAVSPGYFASVGIRLLRGREFTAADRRGAPRVAIINDALALRLFPGVDPIGQRLHDGDPHDHPTDMTVVAVVGGVRSRRLGQPPERMYYEALAQQAELAGALEVRAAGEPAALAAELRRTLQQVMPDLPVMSVRTMRATVDEALDGDRMMVTLAAAFGLAALLLVSIGLYGVISQWAGQRTVEIGVRMALGATAGGVRWLVLRQALVLVAAGVAMGIPAAMASARLLRGALFGVSPVHPPALAGAALLMFAIATVAAYLPARRAARLDPMTALRQE
jgi:predicted permease